MQASGIFVRESTHCLLFPPCYKLKCLICDRAHLITKQTQRTAESASESAATSGGGEASSTQRRGKRSFTHEKFREKIITAFGSIDSHRCLKDFVDEVCSKVPEGQPSQVITAFPVETMNKFEGWQLIVLHKVMACTGDANKWAHLKDLMVKHNVTGKTRVSEGGEGAISRWNVVALPDY